RRSLSARPTTRKCAGVTVRYAAVAMPSAVFKERPGIEKSWKAKPDPAGRFDDAQTSMTPGSDSIRLNNSWEKFAKSMPPGYLDSGNVIIIVSTRSGRKPKSVEVTRWYVRAISDAPITTVKATAISRIPHARGVCIFLRPLQD